ncbi:MAG: hypothetical protein IT176_08615 [Acidobacteria bacterium]|nr:hypothetical protein [Acidobacteriota bacterium]
MNATTTLCTLLASALLACGCGRPVESEPAVATPSVALSHDRAPLGSPIDITYRFVPEPGASFDEDYRVMVHVVDIDDELMWTDDHDPPVPTTQWKAGTPVEYTRTVFIPVYPYVGEASIQVGLYSTRGEKRLALSGNDTGQRAYAVARLQLLPQTENIFTLFKDGWHQAEVADTNTSVEWQWTKKDATLAFKNPKKDATFYLDADNPGNVFHDTQLVTVSINGTVARQFSLAPTERTLQRIPLPAAQLGEGEMISLQIGVDKTFVPALVPQSTNQDARELGIRVFHAFVDAR